MDERALVLTALVTDDVQRRWDELRRAHFPVDRNHLAAHLTLFHALPGAQLAAVSARLAEVVDRTALPARVSGVRLLGRGVALTVASPQLWALRAGLALDWAGWLTRQDAGKSDLHVTVQNKVEPAIARALHDRLAAGFVPYAVPVTGLALWHYAGGPWEPGPRFGFRPV